MARRRAIFSFAYARGPDHDDVLGHDLFRNVGWQLLPAHTVPQSDRHRPFGSPLPDDVLIQFRNNLARRQVF